MGVLKFTVDATLLSELGERLVGRPHIALAELIKNSYDADAKHVELTFEEDLIRIVDDGHGMDRKSFTERWMRVGTAAKVAQQFSPALVRPLTGSKGVGRLSAQLLAHRLELRSVAATEPALLWAKGKRTLDREIRAAIDWPSAQKHKNLTDVAVDFRTTAPISSFANGSPHGTYIELSRLATEWTAAAFEELAKEIWALQPPFGSAGEDETSFSVTLTTPFVSIQESFETQMTALMRIANATVVGRLIPPGGRLPKRAKKVLLQTVSDDDESVDAGTSEEPESPSQDEPSGANRDPDPSRFVHLTVRLLGSATEHYLVEIPDCQLDAAEFEIRVFDLRGRQPEGITVGVARDYLKSFGGVHLYDSGFRLPYYGPDADWLKLELDHARRLSRSQLLPDAFHVRNAMQDLPSNKRVFGTVSISTAAEQRAARESNRRAEHALAIQITRDRLVDNKAFDQLTRTVRLSVDLYALARAKAKASANVGKPRRRRSASEVDESIRATTQLLDGLEPLLPSDDYKALRSSIDTVVAESNELRRETKAYSSLLGALATAGMTSLAYEHEVSKQRGEVEAIARRLERTASKAAGGVAESLLAEAQSLREWSKRLTRIRALFAPLLSEETRTKVDSYRARKVARDVVKTMQVLARGTEIDVSKVPAELVLPEASYAAWVAVLQNLFTNALRATLDEPMALVAVDGGEGSGRGWLRVQNNGVAVDLTDADRFFLPFERDDGAVQRSEALGLGGSGLGLTIVRMIASEIGCTVQFVEPDSDWRTALRVEWKV